MITQYGSLDERSLTIYEYDMINNEQVIIVKVYCTKRDNGMWEFPAPQIFNEVIYNNNKEQYEAAIQAFRNDCMGSIPEDTSLLITQVNQLTKENEMLMKAIAELAESLEN